MKLDLSINGVRVQRREQVVMISAMLFLRRGIGSVKMTDIADECNLGVASIYRYFGVKTQLVIEAGAFLWGDLQKMFCQIFEDDEYKNMTGYEQIVKLLGIFLILYNEHSDFLRFIDEFDMLMIAEKVDKKELVQYEESVFDFYPLAEKAFLKGCGDNSIRKDVDFKIMYQTFSHAITGMCQKFIRGEILPNDSFDDAGEEIIELINMAGFYLHNN